MFSFSKKLILCLILLTPCSSFAFSWITWHPVLALNAGAAFSGNAGDSTNFPIQNPDTDEFYQYDASHSTETAALFGGFLGLEHAFNDNLFFQIGLDYKQIAPFKAKGSFSQGADIESANTYDYHYQIIARQLLAEAKLLSTIRKTFHPYFLLGLGTTFNKAYHYRTTVPPNLTLTRAYNNDNRNSFSYAVGVGVDVNVSEHARFGIGYRFTDLGRAALGNANIDGTPVSGTLSQSHLYANELLAQFTYIFI